MASICRRGFGTKIGLAFPKPRTMTQHPFVRKLTNATRPEYIESMQLSTKGPEKAGGWHPTVLHSSGDLKWTVIRLQPGHGEVPPHFHTTVWDYFVPLAGEAIIETRTREGIEMSYKMVPDTFLAVPAGDSHRVRNASRDQEFVFLIAQSPRSMYDFVKSKQPIISKEREDKNGNQVDV